jgi:glycosyltransferase involved in cell wall biosynthesis
MKILQVTPTFVPSKFGGVKTMSYRISQALTKRGHEVTVYTTDADIGHSRLKDVQGVRSLDGVRVRYFKNVSNLLAFKYRLFLPLGMPLVARKEIGSFDIVHIHDFRSFPSIIVRHYAKKYKVPYVLQARGSLPRIMAKKRLKKLYDMLWGYRLLEDAAGLIALTKTEVKQYKSMGISTDRIEIIPNGVDLPEFENLPKRGEFRRRYSLKDSQKVVLYLGRIHKIKGPDLLAESFAGLLNDLTDAKLVIAGPDDGYLPSLKKLIADLEIGDRVLFTGPLYGQEKLSAYVDADVYVLPSVYETFPNAVLEACACGTPVIVTDQCGIADIINNQAGLVVAYDKRQLSEAILNILGDDKTRLKFSKKGKQLVRDRFNIEKIAGQIESMYKDTLNA